MIYNFFFFCVTCSYFERDTIERKIKDKTCFFEKISNFLHNNYITLQL